MNNAVKSFLVLFHDGSVNESATLEAFTKAFNEYRSTHADLNAKIVAAATEIFQATPGKRLPTPSVVNMVVGNLGTPAADWTKTTEAVHAVLTTDPTFSVRKGRGGGACLSAALPESEKKAQA